MRLGTSLLSSWLLCLWKSRPSVLEQQAQQRAHVVECSAGKVQMGGAGETRELERADWHVGSTRSSAQTSLSGLFSTPIPPEMPD